jgi:hypothetical protein
MGHRGPVNCGLGASGPEGLDTDIIQLNSNQMALPELQWLISVYSVLYLKKATPQFK